MSEGKKSLLVNKKESWEGGGGKQGGTTNILVCRSTQEMLPCVQMHLGFVMATQYH
jgi:hypothetical protein